MSRILFLCDFNQNLYILTEWLAANHQIVLSDGEDIPAEPFDLCIIDSHALDRLWSQVQARKEHEQPVFLPVLLVASRHEVERVTRHVGPGVDELIFSPIEQVELQARVDMLLRARQISLQLSQRNQDLTTFIHAVAHELRSPLQVVTGLAGLLIEEQSDRLNDQGVQDAQRILEATAQMQALITALLKFARLGHDALQIQVIPLRPIIDQCLFDLHEEVVARNAQVIIAQELPAVRTDPVLLKLGLTNLISNAITYVHPMVCPEVTIVASVRQGTCRIEVRDNGIGIAPDDQQRIFFPFVRLKQIKQPGVGLGLSTVKRAMELMAGQVGVHSSPGAGSTFWIEVQSGAPIDTPAPG